MTHMKKATTIAAVLLGLAFLTFGLNFFLQFLPVASPPEGTPAAAFMGALYTTGYLTFIKVLETLGGALVILPQTRKVGLLLLGPVIVNILAFHVFLTKGAGLADPVVLGTSALALFLLWAETRTVVTALKNARQA